MKLLYILYNDKKLLFESMEKNFNFYYMML